MDFGGEGAVICDGDEPRPPPVRSLVGLGVDRGAASSSSEDVDETSCLLPPVANGGTDKRSRMKVQWNDRNGNKLVQVLEFQPSDSDSDNEDGDSCFCGIM